MKTVNCIMLHRTSAVILERVFSDYFSAAQTSAELEGQQDPPRLHESRLCLEHIRMWRASVFAYPLPLEGTGRYKVECDDCQIEKEMWRAQQNDKHNKQSN